jgi:hypothetical protein
VRPPVGALVALALLAPLVCSCAARDERYTYLVDPGISDEQLATLRARDGRIAVRTSADGSQRWLTSPTPVDRLGARVGPLRNGASDVTEEGGVLIGLIEAIINGKAR